MYCRALTTELAKRTADADAAAEARARHEDASAETTRREEAQHSREAVERAEASIVRAREAVRLQMEQRAAAQADRERRAEEAASAALRVQEDALRRAMEVKVLEHRQAITRAAEAAHAAAEAARLTAEQAAHAREAEERAESQRLARVEAECVAAAQLAAAAAATADTAAPRGGRSGPCGTLSSRPDDPAGIAALRTRVQGIAEECRARHSAWRDMSFTADSALGAGRLRAGSIPLQFVRLSDVDPRGSIVSSSGGGFRGEDVMQGVLGDCYLLSAIAVLASRPELLLRSLVVVPEAGDVGVYGVRLWKGGAWVDVIVDDSVVVFADRYKETATGDEYSRDADDVVDGRERAAVPAFGHARSSAGANWWMTILEKAYAKYYGSFAASECM